MFILIQASNSQIFKARLDEEEEEVLHQFWYGLDKEDVEMFKLALKKMKQEKDELVSDVPWAYYPSDILLL